MSKVIRAVKRPVEIICVRWDGDLPFPEEFADMGYMEHENGYDLEIDTLEGTMLCRLDDFIIKGVQGEFYPIKPQIFYETYEEIE